MIPGMQQSSQEFYREVESALHTQHLKNIRIERVNLSEGGIFSAKREYLQIRRDDQVFHVCAAPFGPNFFISWWLGNLERGLWALIGAWPIIGPLVQRFLKPLTYFKIDTALMFQSITHGAVLEALDGVSLATGIRALTGDDRKPVMRDFFAQIGG